MSNRISRDFDSLESQTPKFSTKCFQEYFSTYSHHCHSNIIQRTRDANGTQLNLLSFEKTRQNSFDFVYPIGKRIKPYTYF